MFAFDVVNAICSVKEDITQIHGFFVSEGQIVFFMARSKSENHALVFILSRMLECIQYRQPR